MPSWKMNGRHNIEIIINIQDNEVIEKLMAKAIGQLIVDRINRISIEHRREVCEEILK